MLTLRRVSTIYQYIYPLSSYQYRLKSKDSKPQTPQFNEELLNFEQKNRNVVKNRKSNDDRIEKKQSITRETLSSNSDDSFRNLNRKKKSFNERDRVNLAKPFDFNEKKQKREGQEPGQKQKKSRPHVILDTDSDEVKTLTRQVADSLTPPNASNDNSMNIEQELLDVLRGHRVVSKNTRKVEKKTDGSQNDFEKKQFDRSSTSKKQTRPSQNTDAQKTTEAFSSLLRDIKLKPARDTTKSTIEEDFIRDAVDGSMVRPRFNENREQKRDFSESRRPMRDTKRRQEFMKPHRLWSGESLGIFTTKDVNDLSSKTSPIWEKYEEDELNRISSIPPRNAFEEMIQWTKDGILWKFPIDNEQDIGSEADVPFHEHVLLERHLNDFPNSPLIRQFMELVCVGLGRNPYWTVEQKLEHINWFRTFFNEKMNVFNETVHTGAIKTSASTSSTTSKPVSTYKPKPTPAPAPPKVVPVAPVVPPSAVKTPTASKK